MISCTSYTLYGRHFYPAMQDAVLVFWYGMVSWDLCPGFHLAGWPILAPACWDLGLRN